MVSGHATARMVFLGRDGIVTVPEFRDGRSYAPRRLEDFRLCDEAADSTVIMREQFFDWSSSPTSPTWSAVEFGRSVVEEMAPAVGDDRAG